MSRSCFVIMPFTKYFNDYYRKIIAPTVENKIGHKIYRVDDIYKPGIIANDIFNSIKSADYIIADVSEKNPNVNYELGIAHTLEKPTVILTQTIDDVPFDYKHQRCIVYDTKSVDWQKQLSESIEKSITEMKPELDDKREENKKADAKSSITTNGHLEQLFHNFLTKTHSNFIFSRSTTGSVKSDEKGNCLIEYNWQITARTNTTHIFYRYILDKKGDIEIKELIDLDTNEQLNYVVVEKSDTFVSVYILLNEVLKARKTLRYKIVVYAENYFSNLIDKGVTEISLANREGNKFRTVKETVMFPNKKEFEKIKAKYISHPKRELRNTTIVPKVEEDYIVFELDYLDEKDYKGTLLTQFFLN